MKKQLAMLALAAVCTNPVSAQTVYRCGATYSQTPCAGASQLHAAKEAVSSGDARANSANTRRDARLADAMEKERLKAEARPAPVQVMHTKALGAGGEPAKAAKPEKSQVFTAVAPRKPGDDKHKPTKKKA